MRQFMFAFIALLAFAGAAEAQGPINRNKVLAYEIADAADAAEAAGRIIRVYIDDATAGILVPSSCAPATTAGEFTCTSPVPAMTEGNHRIYVTQTIPATGTTPATESLPSNSIDVRFLIFGPPRNLRTVNAN